MKNLFLVFILLGLSANSYAETETKKGTYAKGDNARTACIKNRYDLPLKSEAKEKAGNSSPNANKARTL